MYHFLYIIFLSLVAFSLGFWGYGHYPFYEFAMKDGRGLFIEPGIGYNNSFCPYRIFESYAILNFTMGLENTTENP